VNIKAAAARIAVTVILPCILSCSAGPKAYRDIDRGINSGSFDLALSAMDNKDVRNFLYPPKNDILYRLDRGIIEHYAGYWEDSSKNLEEGERLIEAAFTRSISQEIGSFILNDNVKEYPGEDYEDLYINVFNALNYYHRGNNESALVEIRRVNEKLRFLSDKYEVASQKITDSNSDLAGREYSTEAVQFSNSALARYLSLLFFRSAGNSDNARIDLQELYRAYELAPKVYYHRPPASLQSELNIPEGKARLNVMGFTGLSPIKEEVNLSIPMPLAPPNNWARLALPHMIDRHTAVNSVEVILSNGQRFSLELLEDISSVVRETFKARYGLILLKTTARTITKSITSAGIARAARRQDEGWGSLIGLIGRVASDLSEGADLRISRYFPGRVYVGGINLDPGVYSITINYYGPRGLVATDHKNNFQVLANRLNLAEFICLK